MITSIQIWFTLSQSVHIPSHPFHIFHLNPLGSMYPRLSPLESPVDLRRENLPLPMPLSSLLQRSVDIPMDVDRRVIRRRPLPNSPNSLNSPISSLICR